MKDIRDMESDEQEYFKAMLPEEFERKKRLLEHSFEGAKQREANKRRMMEKRAWWRRRAKVDMEYGI